MRFCSYPGCNELVKEGRCEKHGKDRDRYRGTAHERGYTSVWNRESKQFLKENPLCVYCLKEKKVVESKVTDHIIPHKGNMDLFWDRNNWQALCKRCHDMKTVREDGGFGRGSMV